MSNLHILKTIAMRFLTVLILVLPSLYFTQENNLIVFIDGANTGSAYVRVEVNKVNLGTIGVGEHVNQSIDTGRNYSIDFHRRGYPTKSYYLLSESNKNVYLKVSLGYNRKWSIIEVDLTNVPSYIIDSVNRSIEIERKNNTQSTADVFYNGTLPVEGENIVTIIKDVNECTTPSSNTLYGIINSAFVGKYRMVNRKELDAVIEEQKLNLTGLVGIDDSIEVGNLLGAKYSLIVDYECNEVSSKINITLSLVSCETSEIKWVGILSNIVPTQIIKEINSLLNQS